MIKYVIIFGERGPMFWFQKQLCYCRDTKMGECSKYIIGPIYIYTVNDALDLIKETIRWRKEQNYIINDYKLYPVNYKRSLANGI